MGKYYYIKSGKMSDLLGQKLKDVKVDYLEQEIYFIFEDGRTLLMYHEQDCCEGVHIEEICGDVQHIIGALIFMAEEVSNEDRDPLSKWDEESYTWTFYKIGSNRGSITIRWYGTSNGNYSERVDLVLDGEGKANAN